MLRIAFEVFVGLLAIYGIISLVSGLISPIRQRLGSESSRVKMVIIMKNQEQTAEGIIRNIFTADILRRVMSNEKLTVIDMGSSDNTRRILDTLKNDYDFFDVLSENEKEDIFKKFDADASPKKEPIGKTTGI
ncbi:hypothetical protein DFR58_101227 [Anaerobacterium chartisolvens]|uniref:Glycosyl transferase family 2 n=1 Tax=Anaerobacterium chartisolvens TaxID=1297424 RepID=A0A369BHI2_9FIRM|nr:hypothetical protein [Anaerobacterium chartisolvens]RCX21022.1 hypothetical protein DFR58_101227 [Anaerobacterium chartisolvens]